MLATAALLAAACGLTDDGRSGASSLCDTSAEVTGSPPSGPGVPLTDEVAPLDTVDLGLELVATIPAPMALTTIPGDDSRVWVAARDGCVHAVGLEPGGDAEKVLDFSDEVSTTSEQGLLGLASAPDGAHLYTSYTDLDGATRIDEYAVDGDVIDEGSRRQVFGLPQPFSNHNGGNIAFGPDGLLYFGLGDGGNRGDPDGNGQNTTTLLGSLIRIDPTADGSRSYTVPADNPFTDDDGRTEIWAYGLRNPWRFSFDRATGDLWIGDVGEGDIEEVDFLPVDGTEPGGRGANLGWNLVEGTADFAGSAPPDHTAPVFEYSHDQGNCSITGGHVYRGEAIPDLVGTYVFGDYCVSEVRGLRIADDGTVDEAGFGIGGDANTLVSFGEDAAGELYVLSGSGEISRIVPG
jgi:glucose/arabinose dehydrogenase